jgi:hypothetical protein
VTIFGHNFFTFSAYPESVMLRLLAILVLVLEARAELPYPVPKVQRLVPPALTAPKDVAIEGLSFQPLPDSSYEVFVGNAVVKARRESPTRIVVQAESVAPLFWELGRSREKRYPVWIKVGGEKSNRVELAIVNSKHGALHGTVAVAKHRLVPAGATVRIRERGLEAKVSADGSYVFRDLPPGETPLVLEWPGVVKAMEQTAIVRPGDTSSAKPFKIEVPAPTVAAVVPDTVKVAEPLLVKGTNFLAEAGAPFEVLIDGRRVRALRASEDAIQIPSEGLLRYLAAVPRKTGRRTAKLVVKVAGVATKPVELTFARLSEKPARRAVAAEVDDAE